MKPRTKQTLLIFWQHSRKYPGSLLLMILGMLCAVASDSVAPFLYRNLFNLITSPNAVIPDIFALLWLILGFKGITWFFWRVATFAVNFFQPRVMADLVNSSFEYIHDHSFNFFNNNFTGSLVRKVNRFERAFEDITDLMTWQLGQAALRVVIAIVVLYLQMWVLGIIILAWALIYLGLSFWFSKFKLPYDIQRSEADTKVTAHIADTITNNLNLKIFGGIKKESLTFKKLTEKLFKIRVFTWNLAGYTEAFQGGMFIILEFAVIYTAVRLWSRGILTIGDIVLVQGFLASIFSQLWDLGRHIRQIYERLADAEEMTEILKTPHEVVDSPNAPQLKVINGAIEFKNISFGYHAKKSIFKNFNLKITAGERVALIGPSGGGKTTIVKLLLRFMDLNAGEILIDDQNILGVTQDSLRNNVALVPQEPILFHRNLFENIAYAKPSASKEEVYRAARLAHCHEFIMQFPDKYETLVGDRGIKLSGGERQRVAIARAILKDAPILVLDEATSSLDSESEHLIQDALATLMKNRTNIVIAHRLSTIMQMDRIIVLDGGKILEQGKHKELLKVKEGLYQKLWGIQAGGFVNS